MDLRCYQMYFEVAKKEGSMGTNKRRRRLLIKQAAILVIVVAAMVGGIWWFLRWWHLSSLVQAQFVMPDGKASPVLYLEAANTPGARANGLMYRRDLPENGGMIFIFPAEKEHAFWMKNTYIPLDMIHINRDMKVVGILEKRPVLSEEAKGVGKPALYVIEVKGGSTGKWGIRTGATLVLKSSLPPAR